MKAYELHPGGIEGIALVERPSPQLGDGDVKVRVRAASLNYRDLLIVNSAANPATRRVPVSDGAGEVIAVGSAVRGLAAGDRVMASFFPGWRDGPRTPTTDMRALGGDLDGMLAEEVVLPASAWVPVPPHLGFEEAATLPCAGVTAYNALFTVATTRPGDVVLVEGTGGVSVFALQLARAAGARVIATSKSAAKRDRVTALGASEVIDYTADPAWGQAVYAAAGHGVDLAVEVGGPGSFDQALAATRFGGTVALIGVLTGFRGDVDLASVFRRGIHVAGVYVATTSQLAALGRAMAAWNLHPVIDRRFAFDEARAAYRYLASGAHVGKVVVTI